MIRFVTHAQSRATATRVKIIAKAKHRLLALLMTVGAALSLSGVAQAQHDHTDFGLAMEDGKIVFGQSTFSPATMTVSDEPLGVVEAARLGGTGPFVGEMGFGAVTQSQLNSTNTPFQYQPLPANTPIYANFVPITVGAITGNLLYWDGTGSVDFQLAPNNIAFQVNGAGSGEGVASNAAPGIQFGFNVGRPTSSSPVSTTSAGALHEHLNASLFATSGNPSTGVYLAGIQFTADGALSSDTVYLLIGAADESFIAQLDDALGAADEYLEENVFDAEPSETALPEPSTVAALMIGLPALGWLKRRRRAKTSHVTA